MATNTKRRKTKKQRKVNRGLRILFKEVLEEIKEATAQRIMDGYSRDENIVLIIGPSSYGPTRKCAFAIKLTKDQSWRGLPLPKLDPSKENFVQ